MILGFVCLLMLLCFVEFKIFFMASVLQIFDMSMWNYGPDVMDALLGLIISLVCGFWASLILLYLMTFFSSEESMVNLL